MTTLNIAFDENCLASNGLSKEEMQQDLKEILAAKLFELGRLTLAQAAAFAGLYPFTLRVSFSLRRCPSSEFRDSEEGRTSALSRELNGYAGLSLWSFMETLSRLKVSIINTTPEQLADELSQT